jgi:signal peptidase I
MPILPRISAVHIVSFRPVKYNAGSSGKPAQSRRFPLKEAQNACTFPGIILHYTSEIAPFCMNFFLRLIMDKDEEKKEEKEETAHGEKPEDKKNDSTEDHLRVRPVNTDVDSEDFRYGDLNQILEDLQDGKIGINDGRDMRDANVAEVQDKQPEKAEDAKDSGKNGRKEKKPEKQSLFREVLSWIEVLAIAVVIAFVLDRFIIANSQVPSGSMENTIMTGSRVIGSRLSYKFGDPERGDIAIFIYPDDEAKGITTYYVKRIIGMPGDTIDIHDGGVYLNGSDTPLDEPYIAEPMENEPAMHFEVPEGCYFMMGDNRNYSNDSRRWENPYVKRDKLIAKVLFRYFPGFKWLDN